jgi:Domain of unknown function (DUF4926)
MSQGLQPHSSAASDRQPPRRYRDLECVQLRTDLPDHGLKSGEIGTIVHVFDAVDTYLVEFINDEDGSTRAEVELTPDQLCLPPPP